MTEQGSTEKKLLKAQKKVEILERMIEDVTRRLYVAQQDLKNKEEYLDNTIKSISDMLIVVDRDGKINIINTIGEKLLGYKEKELLGKSIDALFAEEAPGFGEAGLKRLAVEKETIRDYDAKFLTKRGEEISVSLSAAVMKDREQELIGAVIIARDMRRTRELISNLEKAKMDLEERTGDLTQTQEATLNMLEDLEESKAYIENIIANFLDALIVTDKDGIIQTVNQVGLSLPGYKEEELVGRPLRAVFATAEKEIEEILNIDRLEKEGAIGEGGLEALIKVGPVSNLELYFKTKDGRKIPVIFSSSVMKDKNGNISNIVCVAKDITERKSMEEKLTRQTRELSRSNEELGHFAYVASHDLREPLRMVSSYVQLLGRRYKGKLDKDADEFIHFAVDGSERMQRLINDLLAYSRVGTQGKPFKPVDSEEVIKQVLTYMKQTIEENRAEVTHDSLPEIMADEVQMAQLFQNLIGNAIKFHGKEPPRVHVSASAEGDNCIFSVKDNGIGVEQEHSEMIFQIFQRLHSKSEYPGTGIGLAVCKKIVERHGGQIRVESEPDKGSTFYFTIPKRR